MNFIGHSITSERETIFFFQKKASKINCLQEFTVRIFLKFHKYFVLFQISWENDDRMLKSWILNKNNAPTQNLFQWVSFLYQVAKVLELQLQHQSFQWIFKTDFPHAGKDWRLEEKGMTEDEVVGWHHRLNGHEFEQAPWVGKGQGSLACCSPWGRKESDTTDQLNWG